MNPILPPQNQEGHHFSVMQRIIDGTLKIDSSQEFEEILAFFPNDPFLYRKYADLLLEKRRHKKAQATFGRASELFVEQGMNLQAIVAKILQWSLGKPTHDQGRRFHALLRDKGARYTPLQRFWAHMRYAELVAVMLRLVRVRAAGGEKLTDIGRPAQEVFFVVSGALSETPSPDCEDEAADSGYDTEPSLLGANDIFGDIFPLDQPTLSQSEIRTLTDVELVKISKQVLAQICATHPNIKKLLHELYRSGNRHNCDRTWQTVRRTMRFGIPTRTEITCYSPKTADSPEHLWGVAVDVSLGGMCVEVRSGLHDTRLPDLKGKIAHLHLELQNSSGDLDITGKIVWHRSQKTEKGQFLYIGVRFDSLSRTDRDLLYEYCSGSVGEQNMLWNLWDTMVRTDNP